MLRRRVFTDSRTVIVIDNAASVSPLSVANGQQEALTHQPNNSAINVSATATSGSSDTAAMTSTSTSSTMLSQRRHSLKYTRHVTLPEMHQPSWMPYKYEGSTEKFVNPTPENGYGGTRKGRMHMHQNTWYTDGDIRSTHIFNNPRNIKDYNIFMGLKDTYHSGNKGLLRNGNALPEGEIRETMRNQKQNPLSPSLRRPNSVGYNEANEDNHVPLGEGVQGYHSRWAFKGRDVTAFSNLHWEPYWNAKPMYDPSSVQTAGISSQSRVDMRDESVQFEVTVPVSTLSGNGGQVSLRGDKKNKPANELVTLDLRRDVLELKSRQHVEEFWDRLKYLIEVHRPAVGDLQGEAFKSRFIRNVHDFFVVFQDAVSTHDFQDSYMLQYFEETRPKGMEDLFGIFLEMESNYIHEDHCPRCSLPFATTRYCGEGDENTPFREHRGRWAPHKAWSKEWFDVVERRAEQLWYRAVEDPHFGSKEQRHTQKQAEELLKVYCKTKSRGKALSFLVNLRGSLEYLEGTITITTEMQKMHDDLLDSTPHPHLLTNAFKTESAAAKYLLSASPRLMNPSTGQRTTGSASKGGLIPQSALQFRLDLEMSKFRREQKEEGAVRLPPQGWSVNTSPVVEYRADPRTGHITNWRDVKAGIEKSYLDGKLAPESYTSDEIREIAYLTVQVSQAEGRKQALREQFELEKREAGCKFGKGGVGEKAVVFPDRDAYRVFKTSPDAFKVFDELLVQPATAKASATPEADAIDVGPDSATPKAPSRPTLRYGVQLDVTYYGFPNPSEVSVSLPIGGSSTNITLDVTAETCRVFSGFEMGQVLEIVPTKAFIEALNKTTPGGAGRLKAGQKSKVVILGVSKEGLGGSARAELVAQELPSFPADGAIGAKTAIEGGAVFSLGSSVEEILPQASKALNSEIIANFTSITDVHPQFVSPPALALIQKERQPAGRATVIGSRAGQLWVQWDTDSPQQASVAVSLGSPSSLNKSWNIAIATSGGSSSSSGIIRSPVEPFSWNTPFRNDWAAERLNELKKAPWSRQRYVSLIENKFTPKVKRFGYTQHITQDDFITKEYQDRLTSRQFFNSPQSFEVIPDANVKSVRFSHKDEGSLKLSGLPGADRNEVENGWSKQEVLNDSEVNEIEQALRDISGRRPGNYIKTEAEKSSLELNESWWGAFRPGWKGRNAQQMLNHPSDRNTEDGSKYAFRGKLPPIGTTYGMADRIREIVEDYSRGFGLGPSGHGPLADQGHFNTLGMTAGQTSTLGYINPIVRLFDEKLSKANGSGGPISIEQQVFDWCTLQALQQQGRGGGGANRGAAAGTSAADRAPPNPRNLLLDVKEWRESGKAPSLHLTRMLQDILKQEVAEFNAGVPAGVPRISITNSGDTASGAAASNTPTTSLYADPLANLVGTSANNNDIWADIDRFASRSELHNSLEGSAMGLGGNNRSGSLDNSTGGGASPVGAPIGTELTGYILNCVVSAAVRNSIANSDNGIAAEDESLGPACQYTVISKFLTNISSRIGRGVDVSFMQNQQTTKDGGRMDKNGRKLEHTPKQLIHLDELRNILLSFNVSSQVTDSCIKGLRTLTTTVKDTVPISEIIAWAGPGSVSAGTSSRNNAAANNTKMGDGNNTHDAVAAVPSLAKSLGLQGGTDDEGMLGLLGASTFPSSSSPTTSTTSSSRKAPAAPVNPALWSLLRIHDGRALDIIVAARKNKSNEVLYDEFISCIRGVTLRGPVVDEVRALAGDDSDTFYRGLYDRYTDGTYAPSLEEAVTMFTNFLNTTLKPGKESAARKHYFRFPPPPANAPVNLDESNRLPMMVKPLPVASGIHYFDSVRSSVLRLHAELEAAQIPNPEVYKEYPFIASGDSLIKPSAAAPPGGAAASTTTTLEGKALNQVLSESIQKLGTANPAVAKYWNRLASFQDGALARRLFFGLFSRSLPLIYEYADLAKYVLDDGKTASDASLARVLPLLPTHTGDTAKMVAGSYPSAQVQASGGIHPGSNGFRTSGSANYARSNSNGNGEAALVSQTPSYNKTRHVYNVDSISPLNAGTHLASATVRTILDTTHATSGRPAVGGRGNNMVDNDEGFGGSSGGSGGGASDTMGSANGGVSAYDEQLTVSRTLHSRIANDSTAANKDMKELSVVLANDANAQIEMDFKRNAERYWKRILDGSSAGMLEELSKSSGGGNSGGRGGGGGRGGNRTFNNNGNSRGFGSNNSNTTVGRDKAFSQKTYTGSSSSGGRGGGDNKTIGSSRGGGGRGGGGGGGGMSSYHSGGGSYGRGRAGGAGGLGRGAGGGGLGNLSSRPSTSPSPSTK